MGRILSENKFGNFVPRLLNYFTYRVYFINGTFHFNAYLGFLLPKCNVTLSILCPRESKCTFLRLLEIGAILLILTHRRIFLSKQMILFISKSPMPHLEISRLHSLCAMVCN